MKTEAMTHERLQWIEFRASRHKSSPDMSDLCLEVAAELRRRMELDPVEKEPPSVIVLPHGEGSVAVHLEETSAAPKSKGGKK